MRIFWDAHLRHQARDREVPVPDRPYLGHAVLLRHLIHQLEVVLQEPQHRLGLDVLAHLGETNDVDENHGDARVIPRDGVRHAPPVPSARVRSLKRGVSK